MAQRAHRLINEQGRFRCVICRWSWRLLPSDACPGLTRYAWRTIPPQLVTPAQLQRAGLALPATLQPVGCVVNQVDGQLVALYDLRQLPGGHAGLLAPGPAPATARSLPVSRRRVPESRRLSQPLGAQAVRDWAARLVAQPSGWVVLDTETTGTQRSAEVIDIAVIAPDGSTLLESFVRPQGRIQPGAARVHGIGPAQLRHAPAFDELYPRLQAALRDQVVLAFNAAFDSRILNFCCIQAGLPIFDVTWGCIMHTYQAFAPGQRYNLRAACDQFGLAHGTHRARPDAFAALQVMRAIAGAPPLAPDMLGAAA